MYCPKCGHGLTDGARFCSGCGHAFDVDLISNQTINNKHSNNSDNAVSANAEISFGDDLISNTQTFISKSPSVNQICADSSLKQDGSLKELNSELKGEKRFIRKKQTVWQIILSTIICIFIFILTFTALSALTLRNCFDSDRLKDIPHSVNTEKLENTLEEYGVEKGDMREILQAYEEMEIKEFVDDKIEMFSDFILEGKDFGDFDTDEIVSLIMEERDYFWEETGYELNEDDIREYLDGEGREIIRGISSGESSAGSVLSVIRIIFSKWLIIIFILMVLTLALLLVVVQKFNLRAVAWLSVNVFISSLFFIFVFGILGKTVVSSVLTDYPQVLLFVKTLFGSVLGYIYKLGLTLMLVSMIAFAVYVIIKKVRNNKDKAESGI